MVAALLGLNLAKSSDMACVKAMLRKRIKADVLAVVWIKNNMGKDVPCLVAGPNDLTDERYVPPTSPHQATPRPKYPHPHIL